MAEAARRARHVLGWDVGGAHLKACLVEHGRVVDAGQWPCPLWRGLDQLDAALAQVRTRWPAACGRDTLHAATMTAEMVDLFADREQGVRTLAAHLAESLGPRLRLWAGAAGWVAPPDAGRRWRSIASANWLATATWAAARYGDALLVDIGSTTTDLIVLRDGRPAPLAVGDADRLASGELVYQGVVRTPLCALAPRVPFGGRLVNVMNEWFATTADVYRLTGELDRAHDQHAPADGGGKDDAATRQRLARMIGRDACDAPPAQWLELAGTWRAAQLDEIGGQIDRVLAAAGLGAQAPLVGAGCGDFLAHAWAARCGRRYQRLADGFDVAGGDAVRRWTQVCAPAAAVALLAAED